MDASFSDIAKLFWVDELNAFQRETLCELLDYWDVF